MTHSLPQPGLVVEGRYRLDFAVGQGGFGTVWRATELPTGRVVALKLLRGGFGRADLARFEREAAALRRIQHPGCVALVDFGLSDAGPFLVTEYVEGETLATWARRPHDAPVIVDVALQIADTLAAAHREGVVHRDLKPSNVMISSGPQRPAVKLLDFGIARMIGVQHLDVTKTGEVVGTPGYMSPEQLRGESGFGPASDIYCLGVIIWELLEGRPLFEGATALEIAMRHLLEPAPRLTRAMPASIADLVGRMLDKDPAHRPSAEAVVRKLAAPGDGPAAPGQGIPIAGQAQPGVSRGIVAAVALLVAGLLVAGLLYQRQPAPGAGTESRVRVVQRVAPPAWGAAQVPDRPDVAIAEPLPPLPANGSRGCGSPAPGRIVDAPSVVLLPDTYDPRRAYPLLVAFDDSGEAPRDLVAKFELDRFSSERDVVVLALYHQYKAWQSDLVLADLEATLSHLCIAVDRVFALGDGPKGGVPAQRWPWVTVPVAGKILHAYRMWEGGKPSDLGRVDKASRAQVPVLVLAPLEPPDPIPTECLAAGRQAISLERQERLYAEINECDLRGPKAAPPFDQPNCVRWPGCAALTVTCRLQGGPWPSDVPPRDKPQCKPRAAPFPYHDVLVAFMETVAPSKREQTSEPVEEHDRVQGDVAEQGAEP